MTETGGKKGGRVRKSSGRGQRDLTVKVKTARGRTNSSTRWLQRQLNDPYVARAKAEGFRGRAAFKIMDLDDKYRFLVNGARVVDLGCAPGGWAQVAVPRINSLGEKSGKKVGRFLGIDLRVSSARFHGRRCRCEGERAFGWQSGRGDVRHGGVQFRP